MNYSKQEEVHILITIGNIDFQILITITPYIDENPDKKPIYSCNNILGRDKDKNGLVVDSEKCYNTIVINAN